MPLVAPADPRRQFLARTLALSGVVAIALAALATPAAGQAQTVLDGLNGPVDFALLPDGSVWWLEYYTGDILRQDLATGTREVMFHVDPVVGGERGLVGLGVNQATADAGTFFVYYTVAEEGDQTGGVNHLSRIDDGQETVLLTTTSDVRHNGGRIVILPNGTLFVSTGENDLGSPAQDPDSLLGKILHINPDGTAASGNPHGRTYSLGHRNVYGLAYDPDLKRLFATENGNAERDEVNEILPGRNYGWPACEGFVRYNYVSKDNQKPVSPTKPCDDPAFTPPIGEFTPTGTVAPTGAAILDDRLYWGSWNHGAIHRLVEHADGTWTDSVVYQYGGRINDLEAGLDGKSLVYSNWTHIVRVPMEAGADVPKLAPRTDTGSGGLSTSTRGATGSNGSEGSPSVTPVAIVGALLAAAFVHMRRRAR